MIEHLTYRKANINDLKTIILLLLEDELGQTREHLEDDVDPYYLEAFNKIDTDSNQYLMVVEINSICIATCHLTIMPSLTFKGSTRMQIESVRVSEKYRGQKIGKWMIRSAINYGKSKGVSIIQLTTNKKRSNAKRFYEQLGFEATHEGMKLYLE